MGGLLVGGRGQGSEEQKVGERTGWPETPEARS